MAKTNVISGYDQSKYRALYEDDAAIGGDHLLDETQYGIRNGQVIGPTRYYLNYVKQINLILALADLKDKRVLDIGCGDGIIASRSSNYQAYLGIDISKKRIARCVELYQDKNTQFEEIDIAYGLPFGENSFDVVIASEIIEHVVSVAAFLSEVHRVLVPGGSLVVSTPNVPEHIELRENLYVEQHLRLYSAKRLEQDLDNAGFRTKVVSGTGLQLPMGKQIENGEGLSLLDSFKMDRLYYKTPNLVWRILFEGLNIAGALLGPKYRNQTVVKAVKI